MRQSLDAALAIDPNHFETLKVAARDAESAGKDEDALDYWKRAVIAAPSEATALTGLQEMAAELGRPEVVVGALEEALKQHGETWEQRLAFGAALLQAKANDRALEVLGQTLKERPENVSAVRLMGRAELAGGDLRSALNRFQSLTSGAESSAEDWLSLAECYDDLGDVDKADDAITEARRAAPKSADVLYAAAQRASRMGSHTHAIRYYQELLRIQPKDESASVALAEELYSAKDYKGALSIVEPRAEQQTDNLALQRLLARCQKQLGLLEKAAETFARIASTSKDAAPLHEQGVLLQKLKRYDESVAALREALRRDPSRAMTHYALGATLIHLGRTNEAIGSWRKAIEDAPQNVELRAALAWGLLMTKEADEAVSHAKKALELGLADAGMLRNLGKGFMKADRASDALLVYRRLVEKEPSDAAAIISLAQCLSSLEREDEAIETYQKGILADSRNAELRLALGKAYVKRGEKRAARSQYERLRGLDEDKAALLLQAIEA